MSVLREGIDREKHGEAPPPVLQGVGSGGRGATAVSGDWPEEEEEHRCQNVLEPLVEMQREHLAKSSRNNKGVSWTRVRPGSRRREGLVWWWRREETSCARGWPQRLPDTALLRRRSEDRILRRVDSAARRMRQRITCGFGARPSWRRDGGPDPKSL